MNFLSIMAASFFMMAGASVPTETQQESDNKTIEINSHMSETEMAIRNAAVKVTDLSQLGHGSGSLVQYKDLQLVLTAQHIADAIIGTQYRIIHAGEVRKGVLIYSNDAHDIAVLWVWKPWPRGHAIKWNPTEKVASIGSQITYSGYPAAHSLMTYRGRVAGYELMPDGSTNILLHTYGYFGCSGSVIYNIDREIIGILWGIDRLRGIPVEDMIWVSPIQNLNLELSLRGLCQTLHNEPRACR